MRTKTVLAAGSVALLVLLGAGCASSDKAASEGAAASGAPASVASSADAGGITAQATGKATGVPDLLTVSINAHSEGASAHDTLGANNELAQQVLDTAKAAGVTDADVQTTNVSVGPRYYYPSSGRPRLTGYSADESFSVRLRDRNSAGTVIDQLSAIGDGIQVQGIGLGIDDDNALLASARADAVAKARAKAEQLAAAAGVSVGAVRSITEATPPSDQALRYGAAAPKADAAAVPIAPGTQDLTVTVTVVFDVG